MPTDQNKAVARRLFEALNSGNFDVLDEILAPTYLGHFGGTPHPMDRTTFKQFNSAFFMAFPDLQHTLEEILSEGDAIALRLTLSGTHLGDFQGLPPTGKRVVFSALNIMHFKDGMIVEHWSEFDGLGMMQQMGAIPSPE